MSRLPGCLCGLLLGLLLALPAGARAPVLLDVRYQYDAAGNPTAVTVAGQTRRQAWDALGRLQSQSDALDQTTTYGYDAADAPTRARAPNGAVTTWTPDGFAQPLGETSPDRGSTQYGYDAAGNLTRRTDARGAREETTYDASNRPLERRFYRPDGTLEATHTYTWDRPPRGIGRLDRLDAGPNRIAFDYDLPGHPVGRTYARAGVTLAVQTAHDPVTGLPDTLTYPAQSQLQYRYDTLGRIAAIHWDGQPIADQLQYTAFGALAAARLANGLDHRRTHDAAGRIASYTLAGETTRLTRDAAGQIVALTPAEPGRQQQFGYDAAGRLISYQDPARTERYTYDASGNRLTRARDGQTTPYRYTPNSNRLQTLDALAVAHDAAGNRLSDPTRQYAHDSAGRLVQLQQGATLARYEYNGLGERALKQLGAELRHFVYDERGHLLGEYDTAGRPLAEYAWLGDLPVAYRVYRQVGGLPQTELYTGRSRPPRHPPRPHRRRPAPALALGLRPLRRHPARRKPPGTGGRDLQPPLSGAVLRRRIGITLQLL